MTPKTFQCGWVWVCFVLSKTTPAPTTHPPTWHPSDVPPWRQPGVAALMQEGGVSIMASMQVSSQLTAILFVLSPPRGRSDSRRRRLTRTPQRPRSKVHVFRGRCRRKRRGCPGMFYTQRLWGLTGLASSIEPRLMLRLMLPPPPPTRGKALRCLWRGSLIVTGGRLMRTVSWRQVLLWCVPDASDTSLSELNRCVISGL